jgi:DNA-binding SARP family transcriptional activator
MAPRTFSRPFAKPRVTIERLRVMTMLRIQLLGEFRIDYDGAPVTTINTQRLQSLVAYLLLHRSSPVARQRLAFLLWPDSSEAQARTNLRNLLHVLNKALPDAEQFLATDGQTLQWRPEADYTLDVDNFEKEVGHADSVESLQGAVDFYHGELLPGCYDDWILPERERLEREFTEALEQLIDRLQARHDYREAISYAQRLLRHDPLREETYRRLMRLHALSGDRGGVVRVYNNCMTVLKHELDVEPSRETIQEYEQAIRLDMPKSTVGESASQLPEVIQNEPPMAAPNDYSGKRGMVWVQSPGSAQSQGRIPRLSEYRMRRAVQSAKDLLTWFAPPLTLALLVFVLNVPLLVGMLLSLVIFVGLYLVFNPRTQVEQSRQDIKDEIQQKLDESEVKVLRIRDLASPIDKQEVRARVLRICDLADSILQELKRDEDCTLATASRLEFVLSETRQILGFYVQIILGGVTAHPENLKTTIAKIEVDLLEQLELSLKDFAVKLDQADIVNLEATIRVLESTLKLEGL